MKAQGQTRLITTFDAGARFVRSGGTCAEIEPCNRCVYCRGLARKAVKRRRCTSTCPATGTSAWARTTATLAASCRIMLVRRRRLRRRWSGCRRWGRFDVDLMLMRRSLEASPFCLLAYGKREQVLQSSGCVTARLNPKAVVIDCEGLANSSHSLSVSATTLSMRTAIQSKTSALRSARLNAIKIFDQHQDASTNHGCRVIVAARFLVEFGVLDLELLAPNRHGPRAMAWHIGAFDHFV